MNKLSSPVIYGEVLFDCFPDNSRVLGGAPFNVAWHCQAFGLNPIFISRVGDDELGKEIINAMQTWGLDTQGVQVDPVYKTGIVDVTFNDGEPAYDIVNNSAWDFVEYNSIPRIQDNSLLYHGSLALRNKTSDASLQQLKQSHSKSVFVDVNLRPPWWNEQQIKLILSNARWVKLNQDELSLLVPEENDVILQARYLIERYTPELIVVTRGEAGALAINKDESYLVEPDRATKVIDTVGAGDAFASVLLLGIYKAWPVKTILKRAQEFASKVVGLRGATTQEKSFYQPFIDDWSL